MACIHMTTASLLLATGWCCHLVHQRQLFTAVSQTTASSSPAALASCPQSPGPVSRFPCGYAFLATRMGAPTCALIVAATHAQPLPWYPPLTPRLSEHLLYWTASACRPPHRRRSRESLSYGTAHPHYLLCPHSYGRKAALHGIHDSQWTVGLSFCSCN